MVFNMFYYLIIIVIFVNNCQASQRTLRYALNPGCGEICDKINTTTFHLRADGPNDTLHYLWDFIGYPSVLLAITAPSAKLNIDWENYLSHKPKSINFTEAPIYSFGLLIDKILEFNDLNDTGVIDKVNDKDINVLNPKYFHWYRKNTTQRKEFVELNMVGKNYEDPEFNVTTAGDIDLILNGFCTLEHSDVTPHLLHSENSTQIDFIFNHFKTNSAFTRSRFGIELMMISPGRPDSKMYVDTRKSLDDEHTPGIFEIVEIRTPETIVKNIKESAYLLWRPVSYTSSDRDVTDSTETIHYPLIHSSTISHNSLLYAFYGNDSSKLLVEKINITLGISGDGFYKKTNYATWTFIVGYGIPPGEQFSYLVIMIISIGVGLPVVIMSLAAIHACVRRLPRRQTTRLVNS